MKTQSIWIYLETILTYIDYIILEVNSTLQPPKSTRHASDTTLWTLYTLHSQNSEFHNDLSNSQANSWMIFWSLWEHHLITLYIYIYIFWLVVLTILKNMKVNGKDDIPYIMENKFHVWNHQPVIELQNNGPTLMLKSKNFTTNQRLAIEKPVILMFHVFFQRIPVQPEIQGGARIQIHRWRLIYHDISWYIYHKPKSTQL